MFQKIKVSIADLMAVMRDRAEASKNNTIY